MEKRETTDEVGVQTIYTAAHVSKIRLQMHVSCSSPYDHPLLSSARSGAGSRLRLLEVDTSKSEVQKNEGKNIMLLLNDTRYWMVCIEGRH